MNDLTATPNQVPTGEPLIDTPQLFNVLQHPFAMIPLRLPVPEVRTALPHALEELEKALAEQSILPNGPFFTHHLRMPDTHLDLEVCLPTSAAISPAGRVLPGTWPAGTVARVRYQGDYENLPAAWHEFFSWLGSKHHTPDLSRVYEQYIVSPRDHEDPKRWETDLIVGIA